MSLVASVLCERCVVVVAVNVAVGTGRGDYLMA